MKPAQIERYEKELIQLEAELMGFLGLSSESSQAVELDQARMGRVSRGDAMQQQAMVSAAHQRDQKHLIAVRKALKRIKNDDYGFCLECGEEINLKRLDVSPETELCLDCQSLQEQRQKTRS
ncbi:TraR/DksA family transcriptional regulator [Kangiella taiwanensis]|uniref:Zinc finger DksA/TraR C4-type domain-containing protein n=1 Tax=Kangiella taiwanensis TaxID=1079179 RepID=A0ABP8I457_9GAMM|nr:TraR/DksA C4-type zinc finger protein [Kangiella taiwanensis]